MMSLVSALPLMALVSSALALPLTSKEVTLREIAISESKPELLRTAVKYARYPPLSDHDVPGLLTPHSADLTCSGWL